MTKQLNYLWQINVRQRDEFDKLLENVLNNTRNIEQLMYQNIFSTICNKITKIELDPHITNQQYEWIITKKKKWENKT